jgi:hypothetical protein
MKQQQQQISNGANSKSKATAKQQRKQIESNSANC